MHFVFIIDIACAESEHTKLHNIETVGRAQMFSLGGSKRQRDTKEPHPSTVDFWSLECSFFIDLALRRPPSRQAVVLPEGNPNNLTCVEGALFSTIRCLKSTNIMFCGIQR